MTTRATAHLAQRRLWRMLAISVLALWGCAYSLVHHGRVNRAKAEQIENGLQKLRGLDFVTSVPLVIKNREQTERIMAAEIARDHSDEDLRIGGLTGAMTGLYPHGIDLKAETLKLLRSQIAGFYEPHSKEMVLVDDAVDLGFWNGATAFVTRRDVAGEALLAHELTHALQDQHFQIDAKFERVKNNDDESLALKAVAEGDATIAGLGYVSGHPDSSTIEFVVSHLAGLPQSFATEYPNVPTGLSTPLLFQYSAGVRFVGEAWRRGGWDAVNALYANPPLSTQQIMQPELYFDRPSPPARISLSGYQELLKDWKRVDDDTYGELLLSVILKRNLAAQAPAFAALPQWAGDRIIVLEKGQSLTLLWFIAFRDAESAEKFGEAYRSILRNLPGEVSPYGVEVRSTTVFIAIGAGANRFGQLAPAVWKSSTVMNAAAQRLRTRIVHAAHTDASAG
jgi:hypothetical protein